MRPISRHHAFSIIELLIALVIISILVAMVILIASNRAAEARLRTAQADLRLIAEAEQAAVIDVNYFLRLYVLDDVVGGDNIQPGALNDLIDGLQDETLNTRNPDGEIYGIMPDFGSLPISSSTTAAGSLRNITALLRNETIVGIGLPYISYPRQYEDPSTGENFNVPRDPWGNPYMIFTRQGFINDVDTLFAPNQGLISGTVTMTGAGSFDPLVFDRLTIVSFGPDALPGDAGLGDVGDSNSDDLIIQLN